VEQTLHWRFAISRAGSNVEIAFVVITSSLRVRRIPFLSSGVISSIGFFLVVNYSRNLVRIPHCIHSGHKYEWHPDRLHNGRMIRRHGIRQ
jgi:hypothetical protein